MCNIFWFAVCEYYCMNTKYEQHLDCGFMLTCTNANFFTFWDTQCTYRFDEYIESQQNDTIARVVFGLV